MEHVETLTRYVTHFVDQLVYSGVEHVVISPGSRSTPLAMTFAEHNGIEHWVHLDERSAAFFALGMAKEQQKPVALVCTSGTAAANYYPAVVEAYYSRVPLLVLTADRPHELRGVGAPQAINQIQMFGNYVNWYQDLALPEPGLHMYARRQAARAVDESLAPHPAPVHLNLPFREPLVPDFSLPGLWREEGKVIPRSSKGINSLSAEQAESFIERCKPLKRGLIVVGPQMDENLADELTRLASRLGVPVLADPLSQLRTGDHDKRNIIENYDALLKSETIQEQAVPDYILRFGAMPISKAYLKWVQRNEDTVDHYIVDSHQSYREPAGIAAQFIETDPVEFCRQLSSQLPEGDDRNEWLSLWQGMNKTAKDEMLKEPEEPLNEGHAVVFLADALPERSNLFVGNSMPIRDVDSFFMATPKDVRVMANRGANGIDGVVSTALGSAISGRRTTLLLGDVSFFHDLNGLWMAKSKNIPLTIVVINNNGGGIFSYLPQVNHPDHFEELFGTPVNIDFAQTVGMYGGIHTKVDSWDAYRKALMESYTDEGLSVIEVVTNREDHVAFHKQKWKSVEEAISNRGVD
ncbi:2-succinyl-5-enolpyruvyl-6-hydroxy-3-cyclohexene-1-carboxylic-acid synthase [Halobacillus yeomjeoni]|uniref:2-succinyl-5-enolpyruvyl-6-hydroxy-3- cyclohexene-1-carboxylic-acid synthase n=1 Tax=Halobacillus yeomjeoni TaxID=311194 RepID=UPI001CD20641|nr:2-succinyl-5-enolpyruvyl-6-hydroxy-3-cyclohexene-1-carboxylic-acid synthase [Halobacillus yeomjeoni]MCA0984480.1 2-succinyl-5-enolpyruvyl-6-hydroxy-3-cyclohexene-1-carboxylic-acid synthase [Halobacillus yeomjeoni]